MCAVLCRTWLPKSKAELVGRGFDIGVASSSSSLPLSTRSVFRSVGRGDDERSIHHAVCPSVPPPLSFSFARHHARSLARWDRPFTHSSSSRVSQSLRPRDACSATRPSSLHSILCHAVTTYNKGQSKERASKSAASNQRRSFEQMECVGMWSDGRRGSIIPIPSQQQPRTRLSDRASAVPEMDGANVRDLPPSKTLGGGGGGGDIHRQQTDFLGIFFARRRGRPQCACGGREEAGAAMAFSPPQPPTLIGSFVGNELGARDVMSSPCFHRINACLG